MSTKILTIAAVALSLTAGVASAADFQNKTEAGAGLFDQGGAFYQGAPNAAASKATYGYQTGSVDTLSTQSITNGAPLISHSAVPADNARNERGQALFDGIVR